MKCEMLNRGTYSLSGLCTEPNNLKLNKQQTILFSQHLIRTNTMASSSMFKQH